MLVFCHAGCGQAAVIGALQDLGLWSDPIRYSTGGAGFAARVHRHFRHVKCEAIGTLDAKELTSEERVQSRLIVATYDYTDEFGQLLYQVVRLQPKDFRQRRPDGRGGWIWKKSSRQVLFHLPELLSAEVVFIVEGERDVETLRDHGFAATTNAGGARARWLDSYTEAVRGREVVLIPDADPPGRSRVLRIARSLIGAAAKIVVLELEGVKDVTDWFDAGHSELELIALVEGQAGSR